MGLITTLANWWSARMARRELALLGAEELRALVHDLGLSADQLMQLTAQGSSDDLPRLMRAFGLAPERTERAYPDVMRNMSIICSGCKLKRRCRSDVDCGWAPVVQRYCPNTHTIKALHRERYESVLPRDHR
jgi:uncharacterized protein YjiS (DUF1127 family)